MGRKTYLGGSTIINTGYHHLSGRKPKSGAMAEWIRDAGNEGLTFPEDVKLKPVQRFEKSSSKKKRTDRKKRKGKRGGGKK